MDRARAQGVRRPRTGTGNLKRWLLFLFGVLACSEIVQFDRVVAIDILGSVNPQLEAGDTLRLRARAVSAASDTVPDAMIVWERLNVDSQPPVLSLDTATGTVTGLGPGTGRVQARHENLRSGLITVTITARPDTITADSVVFSVTQGAGASPPLVVRVADATSMPGELLALTGKMVHYHLVAPAGSGAVRLVETDGSPGSDPLALATVTGSDGTAAVLLERVVGTQQPDTAFVEAVALTAIGDTVSGSPVRFVVLFEPE